MGESSLSARRGVPCFTLLVMFHFACGFSSCTVNVRHDVLDRWKSAQVNFVQCKWIMEASGSISVSAALDASIAGTVESDCRRCLCGHQG